MPPACLNTGGVRYVGLRPLAGPTRTGDSGVDVGVLRMLRPLVGLMRTYALCINALRASKLRLLVGPMRTAGSAAANSAYARCDPLL